MNQNPFEMNTRGNNETILRVRQTEQAYRQWKQASEQNAPKPPASLKIAAWEAAFSRALAGILPNLRMGSAKQSELSAR